MKTFLLKCLLYFSIFFILEKALLLVRNSAPGRELDQRLEWILQGKIEADLLVFGSSRGARDIIASQAGDSLGMKAFNLSYPGSNILFHEYLLSKLLQYPNKKPQVLILALDDPYQFKTTSTILFRYDRLYPLVKYEDVRNTLIEHGEKDAVLSRLFVVHQLGLSNFDFRKKHFDPIDTIQADGSMPIVFRSPKFNSPFNTTNKSYDVAGEDSAKIGSFKRFLDLCRRNNIKVLLALAPNYGLATAGFAERVQAVAGESATVMQYDSTQQAYRNARYFYDAGHLTREGAEIFTREITDFIRSKGWTTPEKTVVQRR